MSRHCMSPFLHTGVLGAHVCMWYKIDGASHPQSCSESVFEVGTEPWSPECHANTSAFSLRATLSTTSQFSNMPIHCKRAELSSVPYCHWFSLMVPDREEKYPSWVLFLTSNRTVIFSCFTQAAFTLSRSHVGHVTHLSSSSISQEVPDAPH